MAKDRQPIPDEIEGLAKATLDAAFHVHRALGPGLLESVYERCLAHRLRSQGVAVQAQVAVPIQYDGLEIAEGLRLDLLVGGGLVVEVKAVEALHPVHKAQLLTYLKLTGKRLGLLLNFNVELLKDGIVRVIM